MPITIQNDVIFGSGQGYFGRAGSDPEAVVLSDGRIAIVWTEYQYPGDGSIPGIDYNVWTRILNADGTPATSAILVNDTEVGSHGTPQIAALSDGGYAVTWVSMDRSEVEGDGQTVYVYDAQVRSFSSSGAPEGPATAISPNQSIYDPANYNSILASNVQGVNAISLEGGGALMLYDLRGGGGAYDEDGTFGVLVDNAGQPTGDPVRIWQDDYNRELAQLASGDLVFVRYDGQLTGYTVQITGADLVSAPTSVPGATGPVFLSHDPVDVNSRGYSSGPRIVALSDGGFAVMYAYDYELGADDDESLEMDRYDAAGNYLSTVSIPVPDDSVQQPGEIPYQMLALDGGRVLVVWTHVVAYGDTDLMGVVINADGSLESVPATINPNTAGYQPVGQHWRCWRTAACSWR
ncbi:MAG: hypothetical protein R3D85_07105 [Paracoccaceae bacterium]